MRKINHDTLPIRPALRKNMTRPGPGRPCEKNHDTLGPRRRATKNHDTLHGQLGPGLAWAELGFLAPQTIKKHYVSQYNPHDGFTILKPL